MVPEREEFVGGRKTTIVTHLYSSGLATSCSRTDMDSVLNGFSTKK